MDFFKGLLPRLQLMDIKVLGGGLYSYWPLDPAAPMDKEADLERAIKKDVYKRQVTRRNPAANCSPLVIADRFILC